MVHMRSPSTDDEMLILMAYVGANSQPKSTKRGMEMEFSRYQVVMHDYKTYLVGRWERLCSMILSYRGAH